MGVEDLLKEDLETNEKPNKKNEELKAKIAEMEKKVNEKNNSQQDVSKSNSYMEMNFNYSSGNPIGARK